MAQDILSIRMDKDLKRELGQFCEKVGLSISSVINMYARKVVDEQKIPFEISVKKQPDRLGYINAMKAIREQVVAKYPEQMTIKDVEKLEKEAEEKYLGDNYFVPYEDVPTKDSLLIGIDFSIAVEDIREDMSKKYPDEVTLDEINEAIDEVRRSRK